MSRNSKDTLISLVSAVLALCFLLFVIPAQVPLPKFDSGGTTPRAIPQICCWLVLAMSAVMFIRSLMQDKNCLSVMAWELSSALQSKKGWSTFGFVMLIFLLSVVYYLGYASIGFFITTLVLFPVYAFALGCRKPVSIIVTDLVLTFGVYYFFAIFMKCFLPGWAPF